MRQWWSARRKAELVKGTSPRGLTCDCNDKVEYIYSALLHICRVVFSCCGSVAALALTNCNEHVAEKNITKYFATAPIHTQRAFYGSQSSGGFEW
jgi:hypothetical protein